MFYLAPNELTFTLVYVTIQATGDMCYAKRSCTLAYNYVATYLK